MLKKRLRTIILVFAVLVLLVIVLLMGFRAGYGFIKNQDQRQQVIDAMVIKDKKKDQEGEVLETGTTTSTEIVPTYQNGGEIPTPKHVTVDTPGAIEIFIRYGWSTKQIAEALIAKGVIDEAVPFAVMAKLNGFDGRYQQGTHFVLKGMDYNEIMFNLSLPPERTTITFIEGSTYIDIKNQLKENGVKFDEKKMDELMNKPSVFKGYSFITNVPTNVKGRYFDLEGYLFPDTYSFDLNADEEEIIETFLANTDAKLTAEIRDRAEEVGYSLDTVLNMAALIQNEAGAIDEMYKVSRVFHNRMADDERLQSCATANYLRQIEGKPNVWYATEEDIARDNLYNTYMYAGLPAGPIGNPGLEAIRAALYPDTDEPYLYYFVAKGDGTNAFANTYEEHEANIAEYSENWTNPRQ